MVPRKKNRQKTWIIVLVSILVTIIVLIIAFVMLVLAIGKNEEKGTAATLHLSNAYTHFNSGGGPQGLTSNLNLGKASSELTLAKTELARYRASSLTSDEDEAIATAIAGEISAFENLIAVVGKIIADGTYFDTEIGTYDQAWAAYTLASSNRNRIIQQASN